MTPSELYHIYQQHPFICTDTRKITPDCLFFALKGENFDANDFAETALAAGASFAVVDKKSIAKSDKHILVDDVLKTLQDLARTHRNNLKIPFIGITGTNGKTTSKELINSVLSQHFKTYATLGNLNNHIGVPLTILAITSDIEIAIIEMGANHQKEIEFLCGIARPTHGLITNVGKAHLEGFGGFEGVKKTKSELYAHLAEDNGVVFINRDNKDLMQLSRKFNLDRTVYYGTGEDNFISGSYEQGEDGLIVNWEVDSQEVDDLSHRTTSHLTGTYNFENIMAAICIGSFFRLSKEEINNGISTYTPTNNRSQLKKTEKNTLICDYYNANPSSMFVALDNFASLKGEKKVMILGDMFELGNESDAEHKLIFEKAIQVPANHRIFIGYEFSKLKNEQALFFESTASAAEYLKANPVDGALVLIKGSRGMKLENLVDLL